VTAVSWPQPRRRSTFRTAATLFVVLTLADAALTTIGIALIGIGGEANPLMVALYARTGLAGFWLVKFAEIVLVIWILGRLDRGWCLWILSAVMTAVVALNAITVLGLLAGR